MRRAPLLLVLSLLVLPVLAAPRQNSVKPAPAVAATGIRAELIANMEDAESKLVSLAEAIPAEKYTWRPDKGVRSVSEVYMHLAASNYFLATFMGVPAPKLPADAETSVKAKQAVIAELKRSFDHLRTAAMTSNLDQPARLFGKSTTSRGVFLTIVTHLHEHLGQLIAYARSNEVIPPWSH